MVAVLSLAGTLLVPGVSAASATIAVTAVPMTTYVVPGDLPWLPGDITAGPDGGLWFSGRSVGRIDPLTAEFTAVDDTHSRWITTGTDGGIWFADEDEIGRIDPGTNAVQRHPFEGLTGIAAGTGGRIWYSVRAEHPFPVPTTVGLGWLDPDQSGGFVDTAQQPRGIVEGADGNLWFTADTGGIGRLNRANQQVTYFDAAPLRPDGPITPGPDGWLWFLHRGCPGRLDPFTGVFDGFASTECPGRLTDLAFGDDGRVWFTMANGSRVADLDPVAGVITEHADALGHVGSPGGITAGPDGNIWFASQGTDRIGVVHLQGPSVSIRLTTDEGHVRASQPIHYHLTVANTGDTPLTGVAVSDAAVPDCEGPVGALAVGQHVTVDCEYSPTFAEVGTFTNVAWVDSDQTPANDSNTTSTTITASPDLSVSKAADERTVVEGEPIHYHVTVTNTGDIPLTGVTVTDAGAPGCAGPVADIPVGDDVVVDCTYTTTGADGAARLHSNQASADSNETTAKVTNIVTTTVEPRLTLVKAADESSVVAGDDIDYHLTLTNTWDAPLTGIVVTDPNAPGCDGPVADLAPDQHVTVDCTYTTTFGDVGTYTNVATADGDQITAVPSNPVHTTVTADPSLSVTTTADQDAVVGGDDIDLHVTIENTGDVPLTEVTVSDPNAPDCEGPVADLAVGADLTVDCTHTTAAGDDGPFTNVATVDTAQTDPVASDEVVVLITPRHRPDLEVRLESRPWVGGGVTGTDGADQTATAIRRPGGRAVFFVRIANHGAGDDRFDLRRVGAVTPAAQVRYFVGRSATDITQAVLDRTYRTPELAPGESVKIRVEISLAPGARLGRTHAVLLRTRSVGATAAADTVRAAVTVR